MSVSLREVFMPVFSMAAAALVLAGCGDGEAQNADARTLRDVATVETLTIEFSEASSIVKATGRTMYMREAALGFGSPGEIMSILVDEGDRVKRNQTVASLRRINVGADAAEADLARQTAQNNYERMKTLHASGAVSDIALEDARLALERTRQTLTIKAPKNGVVLKRLVERGQIVGAGSPIVVIGEDEGGVVANVSLNAAQMTRIGLGDEVDVDIRERGRFDGVVSRISPATSTSGVFPVEIALKTDIALRAGEVVEVAIKSEGDEEDAGRVVVPAIALVDARADQGAVFVLEADQTVRRRSVQTSGVDRDGVVVNFGLSPGETIVTRGASLLRDGDQVRISVATE